MAQLRIRKGDIVQVIAGVGASEGKRGRVLRVLPAEGKVLVEGVRMVKKHLRPNPQRNVKGGIAQKEAPLAISNVLIVCEHCARPVRVGVKRLTDGKRARFCRRCKGEFAS
jgi:large subunit ribosomal protein L24